MHLSVSFRILGILLMLFSSIQLVPLTMALLKTTAVLRALCPRYALLFFLAY